MTNRVPILYNIIDPAERNGGGEDDHSIIITYRYTGAACRYGAPLSFARGRSLGAVFVCARQVPRRRFRLRAAKTPPVRVRFSVQGQPIKKHDEKNIKILA